MTHYPSRSAQEAALTAVNLAPSAIPSEESSVPERSEAEALTSTHGLLILERTPHGVPSWLACKFCPLFGCKSKKKHFLKLYRLPDQFSLQKVESHLRKEHTEKWEEFRPLDEQKKKEFFQEKTLPSQQQFRKRMEDLQRSWGPTKRKKATKRLRSSDSSELLLRSAKKRLRGSESFATSLQHSAKRITVEENTNFQVMRTLSLPTLQEDWIGRTAFQSAVTQSVDGQLLHKPDVVTKSIPRRHALLPGNKLYQHLRTILQRYSEPFSRDLQQALNQPLVESEGSLTPVWNDADKADLAACVLFYLLRGIPIDVATTLLKESNCDSTNEDINGLENSAALTVVHTDPPEKNNSKDVSTNQMDVNMSESTQELEVSNRTKHKDELRMSEDAEALSSLPNWENFLRKTAFSISITALLAVKRILSKRQSWAFVISTRSCPIRKDAVEILIPLPPASSALNSVTLVAPSPRAAPLNDVQDQTIGSSTEPGGADVENTMEVKQLAQGHMKKQATNVISRVFSHLLISDGIRNTPTDCSEEGMRAWIHERIMMCLRQSLGFLIESGGISNAKERLKKDFVGKPFCEEWFLASTVDAISIDAARMNYSKRNPDLKDHEWEVERQVITGLVTCYQKAIGFTPITRFSSTLMYAKAIVRKAITNFEMFMQVTRRVPRMPVEALHLISVREGSHAVESVIGLLDLVYPLWPSRLIGVRSEISKGASGKPLEEALVKALQERLGRETVVVDRSIPEEERPIYPSKLAKMNQDDFGIFVNSYIRDASIVEDKFIEKLLFQHEVLRLKEVANGVNKSWANYQDLTQLRSFVEGLELLWNGGADSDEVNQCRFAGLVYDNNDDDDDKCKVVDCNVEHVLNARTLMEVEQTEKLDAEAGKPQSGDVGLKDYLIPWGENWSNLLNAKVG